jgi:integrase
VHRILTAANPRDAGLFVLMVVGAMRVGEVTLLAWKVVQKWSIIIPGGGDQDRRNPQLHAAPPPPANSCSSGARCVLPR